MSDHGKDHQHGHGHHEHGHQEHGHLEHGRKPWRWHKDWRTWVGVILMLAAMVAYWLSVDERFQPGRPIQEGMPAVAP